MMKPASNISKPKVRILLLLSFTIFIVLTSVTSTAFSKYYSFVGGFAITAAYAKKSRSY